MEMMKTSKPIRSLEKALHIIEIMANELTPMRLMDIAAAAELPASTALRLLHTLQTKGYVVQETSSARYYLSLKLFHIGNQISSSISIIDIARPYLNKLATQTGHSINLAVPQGQTAVMVDVINGFAEDELIITRPGRIVPLYCSAIGRALMLDYTEQQMNDYFEAVSLEPHTMLTITNRKSLIQELAQSRMRGYTHDPGELRPGIVGVGAPVKADGHIVASISLAELATIATPEMVRELGQAIAETARKISQKL